MNNRKDLNHKPIPLSLVICCLACFLFLHTAELDKSGFPFLKWKGPGKPGTFEEYISKQVPEPEYVKKIVSRDRIPGKGTRLLSEEKKIMVLASKKTFQNLSGRILRYCSDVNAQGYTVELYEYSGIDPAGLKSFLVSGRENLRGSVFIGNLPVAWYEVEDDYFEYGYAEFPCDLYYMDLDGAWEDLDGDGRLDSHQDGIGDREPEIFVGRIDASGTEGDEIDLLSLYFDRNHKYRSGGMVALCYGLTYTEDDWSIYSDMVNDISSLYPGRYDAITAPATDRNDYLENRLLNVKYDFVQLACHSSSTAHYFTRNGLLVSQDIRDGPPQALAYNLFCCSALRFTDFNCLGKAYVFNAGRKALTVVGSTKTGSMLEFSYFYQAMDAGNPVGPALKEWLRCIAPYDIFDVFWHYGMTILGDPVLVVRPGEREIGPPVNAGGSLEENCSLLSTEYINVLTWESSFLNAGQEITGTRLYVIEPDADTWLQDLELQQIEYLHRRVDPGKRYVYALVNINSLGQESWPAVVEIFEGE